MFYLRKIKDGMRRMYIVDRFVLTITNRNIILDSAMGTGNITRQHTAYLLRKWRSL